MTDRDETSLYVILNLQNQGQIVTVDALRQPTKLLGFEDYDIETELGRLIDLGLLAVPKIGQYQLTDRGWSEASRVHKIKAREEFNSLISRACGSDTYLDLCAELYGYRMPFFNMMDQEQLDFVFNRIPLTGSDIVLDFGCGNGCILSCLADKYGCSAIGIDQVDAQGAARNGKISYIRGDLDDFLKYSITPTVCLAVDSLYFSTDLRSLIKDLAGIAGNRMYLFYSQYVFDSTNKDKKALLADHTRLAVLLREAGLGYETIDYSANERYLYENGLITLPRYREAFESEGNLCLYEKTLQEYTMGKELYDEGLASRYLYIVLPEGSKSV